MNEIKKFQFKNSDVRTLTDEAGEPWFVAKDVCEALGYSNPSKTISDHLDDDERSNVLLDRGGSLGIINESGLYTLIIRSNKPEAKQFRKWVTSEVLPAIRKTGSYTMGKSVEIMEGNYEYTLQQMRKLKDQNKSLKDTVLAQTPYWAKIKRCKDMDLTNAETARVICKSSRFVSSTLKKMAELGIKPDCISFRLMLLEGELQIYRLENETLRRRYPDQFKHIDQDRKQDPEGGAE